MVTANIVLSADNFTLEKLLEHLMLWQISSQNHKNTVFIPMHI